MGLLSFNKSYQKKSEKKFTRQISRKQVNFPCDVQLSNRIKFAAGYLETPIYPLMEHALELGMAEMAVLVTDETLKEGLMRHLLQEHLLVKDLNSPSALFSQRVRRMRVMLLLMETYEKKGYSLEEIREALEGLEQKAHPESVIKEQKDHPNT